MIINYIFRSKEQKQYSIENVFNIIIDEVKKNNNTDTSYAPTFGISIHKMMKNIKFARHCKGDIFHVTGDIHYVLIGLPKKKTILTVHDLVGLEHFKRKPIHKFFYKLFWAIIPSLRCNYITTVSEKSKKEFLKVCPWAKKKIYVIPNPINKCIKFEEKVFCKEYPTILLLGTSANKNHIRIIEAIKDIPCRLDIIGKLPKEEKQLLEKYKIEYVNGHSMSDDEISKKYINCDIVLFASTYEGFGMPIIEGQEAGRVVITSSISPMLEVASDGACLVDPYNIETIRQGVIKVISDDTYRNQLIMNGRRNAQAYKSYTVAEAYQKLYDRIVGK